MVRAGAGLRPWPWLAALLVAGQGASAAEQAYAVVGAESRLAVHVGRAGLFKFAGHEHQVLARSFEGRILAEPEALERSSVSLRFDAGALRVSGEGEPPEDVPKVQEAMLGPKVLDSVRFPSIAFRTTRVSGKPVGTGVYELQLTGELSVRDRTVPLILPVRVEIADGRLVASGRTAFRQSAFGINPISVAGVVKVKDELAVEFQIVARAER
jgi:polyisoprenoid-binding protein YceI